MIFARLYTHFKRFGYSALRFSLRWLSLKFDYFANELWLHSHTFLGVNLLFFRFIFLFFKQIFFSYFVQVITNVIAIFFFRLDRTMWWW